MKKQLSLLLVSFSVILLSCSKGNSGSGPGSGSGQQGIQLYPQRFYALTQCTTYNSNGTILAIGTPYSYTVTIDQSAKPGFNLHFLNFTGDADTSVNATTGLSAGSFTIPLQNFTTSTGTSLQLVGQGAKTSDSLNYAWSFYMGYKSHDCTCKSKQI